MNIRYLLQEAQARGLPLLLRRRGLGRLSLRAVANAVLNRMEASVGRTRLISNPTTIQIEPTTACNLNCTICGRRTAWSALRGHQGFMPWETFLKTEPFLRTARRASLSGWGESLLHPNLPAMVRLAKRAGCMVSVTTNGLLLDEKLSAELVDAGLDTISISLEGATAETYRAIRGASLELLVSNLKLLARAKRLAGSPFPCVQLVFCIMKRNLSELVDLVNLAHECGVGEIAINNLIVYSPDLANQSVFGSEAQVQAAYTEADRRSRQLGVVMVYKGTGRIDATPQCAFTSLAVMCDGAVGLCGAQRAIFGDIHSQSLRNLWNGTDYRAMRRKYSKREYPEQCRRCPNHTNAREDHESPDISYVEQALGMRHWDRMEKCSGATVCNGVCPGSGTASAVACSTLRKA